MKFIIVLLFIAAAALASTALDYQERVERGGHDSGYESNYVKTNHRHRRDVSRVERGGHDSGYESNMVKTNHRHLREVLRVERGGHDSGYESNMVKINHLHHP